MLLEAAIIYVSYHAAIYIRFTVLNGVWNLIIEDVSTELLILLYSLCTVTVFYLFHLYIPVHQLRLARELSKLVLLSLFSVLILGSVLYVIRFEDFSRLTLAIFVALFSCALCLKRAFWHHVAALRYAKGIGMERVILIGSGRLAEDYYQDLKEYPQFGRRVVGYIGANPCADLEEYLGGLDRIEEILETIPCEEVVVALEPEETVHIQAVLNAAGKEGLRVSMIPFYRAFFPSHPTIETMGRSVLIDLRATPLDNNALAALKRVFDFVCSALLLVVLSPLLLVVAVIVKLESPGPVFFRQVRVGFNKKEFTMLKFRSMRVNSESDTAWSRSTDPRRTRFGSFIRRYSIDELPQLINVLKGDMSLVGPRPELPYYVYQFKESVPLYLVRQQVRPGMTGWAQIHGLRGDTSIQARVKYDIWYIENWSPGLDLHILWKTAFGGFVNAETQVKEKTTEKANA